MPTRIQRKRTAGWTAPLDVQGRKPVYVGRGSKWGNPARIAFRKDTSGWHVELNGIGVGAFTSDREARRCAVEAYWIHLDEDRPELFDAARAELAGRDLMCWCATDQPCHADVLLALATAAPAAPRA